MVQVDVSEKGMCVTQRNACIFADAQLDRSPTGTGTSGRLAQLVAKKMLVSEHVCRVMSARLKLKLIVKAAEGVLVNRSVVGSTFRARVARHCVVGASTEAVVPRVSGTASMTGFATWILQAHDEFPEGFLIS